MPIYSAFTAAEKMAFLSAMLSNSWLAEFFYVGGPDSKLDCTFRLHFQGLCPILISGCAKSSFSGFFFWQNLLVIFHTSQNQRNLRNWIQNRDNPLLGNGSPKVYEQFSKYEALGKINIHSGVYFRS